VAEPSFDLLLRAVDKVCEGTTRLQEVIGDGEGAHAAFRDPHEPFTPLPVKAYAAHLVYRMWHDMLSAAHGGMGGAAAPAARGPARPPDPAGLPTLPEAFAKDPTHLASVLFHSNVTPEVLEEAVRIYHDARRQRRQGDTHG
jgi:hypothetical protein